MRSTIAATLLVSLRRTRAAWPIVLAAGLTCLLASSLLAAGPMYASAVSVAGLHRVLADAPVADGNIEVSLRVAPDRVDTVDALVVAAIGEALQGVGGSVARFVRSDTFDLPVDLPGTPTDLVGLAAAEDLADHATLVEGAWPRDGADGPIDVAVMDGVAASLDLRVGDVLSLTSRLDPSFVVPVRVAGTFRIDDPGAPYWWGEAQVLDGVTSSQEFTTHGPFFTTRRALLDRATLDKAALSWRAYPATEAMTLDATAGVRTRIEGLDRRIEGATGIPTTVETDLPAILAAADRSLLVSRTGVLLLIIQLAVLAAYAVLLSAALLVDHRRMDTAMLRSRGAGPARIAALTLVEALVLTVPAALLGPWVALAALGMFDVIGPLTTIGLHIDPTVSVEAYAASTLAAAGCLVALVLPALPSRRSFAAVRSGLARAGTMTAGQRSGLDIALLVVAALGVWQLRHYGAPLTRSVQGAVGIDPLLVATPAIGLLAGAVVALRLLPLLARAIERLTATGRGLVSSLGARQLARRPLRYTRAALLLMLAMAMGVFAVSYTWTWTASQRDQAAYQVGGDVRVVPGTRTGTPPRWALDQAYASVDGIDARTPVDRAPFQPPGGSSGEIVALDAVAAPTVATLRSDLASAPMADLMAPLAEARPTVAAPVLPDGTRRLHLDLRMDVREAVRVARDLTSGEVNAEPVGPADLAATATVTPRVVLRDATGGLHRVTGDQVALGGGIRGVDIDLAAGAGGEDRFARPVDLLAIELVARLPSDQAMLDGTLGVDAVQAASADGPWVDVPLGLAGGWRTTASVQGAAHVPVGGTQDGAAGIAATVGSPGLTEIPGVDQFGRATTIAFAPTAIDDIAAEPIRAVASDAFLEAGSLRVGDTVPVEIGGLRRPVSIVASVRGFPTVDPDVPTLVMDLPTLALVRFAGSDAVDPPDEWWFSVDDARQADVAATLTDRPFDSRTVTTVTDRERALATDPVALGIIGALAIGFVAAALFAVVGFVVSAAVSARERVGEFALLRAIGLSSGQLSGWLSLENAVLATVSLVCGTALGLLIAWVVLPFVTVTQTGATPYPPVDVAVPWATIAILEAVAILTLSATVVGLAWLLRRIGLAAVLRTGEE